MESQLKEKVICKKCILHSKIPGVDINETGLCNACQNVNAKSGNDSKVADFFTRRMESLFDRIKKENHIYDALVLVSGGKDSTKLLNMMTEKYHLNILALTVVTPFVTKAALQNVEDMIKKMKVDLIKYYVNEEMFKEVLRHALLHGEEYGIHFNGPCQLCYYFIYWAGIRIAMQMDIPILIAGRDKSQRLNTYISGESVKKNIEKGIYPYGIIHKLFDDAVEHKYGKTFYHFDKDEILRYNYPTELDPLSFIKFKYEEIETEIEKAGLEKENYKKLRTTCKAIHFFDLFSYLKYDCPSSVHEWANGLRLGYPELMQLNLSEGSNSKVLDRDTLMKIMQEYKEVLMLVAHKKMNQEDNFDYVKREVVQKGEITKQHFSEEAFDMLINNIWQIDGFASYFNIDLKKYVKE